MYFVFLPNKENNYNYYLQTKLALVTLHDSSLTAYPTQRKKMCLDVSILLHWDQRLKLKVLRSSRHLVVCVNIFEHHKKNKQTNKQKQKQTQTIKKEQKKLSNKQTNKQTNKKKIVRQVSNEGKI